MIVVPFVVKDSPRAGRPVCGGQASQWRPGCALHTTMSVARTSCGSSVVVRRAEAAERVEEARSRLEAQVEGVVEAMVAPKVARLGEGATEEESKADGTAAQMAVDEVVQMVAAKAMVVGSEVAQVDCEEVLTGERRVEAEREVG